MSWVEVAKVEDCEPGSMRLVEVAGKEVGLFNLDGQYYAVLNHCPHQGAPICKGRVKGRVTFDSQGRLTYDREAKILRCPWHHWEFDLDSGKALVPINQRIKRFPVKVWEGSIFLQV